MKIKTIKTFGRYLKEKFGERVYKIPLNISGFTCPNIDGTKAKGGCSYCENESFSPHLANYHSKFLLNFHSKENPLLDIQLQEIENQYNTTKKTFLKQYNIKKYIAYFQSFSNTYAPLETLKALYKRALEPKDVVGISIGTRADCIKEGLFEFLKELDKEVWIEIGVQSIFDETLEKINRAETFALMEQKIKEAKAHNIKVCAHLIFGLPDENEKMMLKSTQKMVELGVEAIKFHPCYVTKNTALANEYRFGDFVPIEKEEYIKILINAIKLLPQDMIVQRISAGIQSDILLAPLWCKQSKNKQMADIKKAFLKEGIVY